MTHSRNNKKIMIVEDEASLNNALSEKLTSSGYQCVTAFDGQEALDIVFKEKPDLIILDLLMPKMDGDEFLRQLRKDPWGKDVRVIILTNYSLSEEKIAKSVIESHPTSFFVKSSTKLKSLVSYIEQLIPHS
jgi:CheY-like chemotaxis protein